MGHPLLFAMNRLHYKTNTDKIQSNVRESVGSKAIHPAACALLRGGEFLAEKEASAKMCNRRHEMSDLIWMDFPDQARLDGNF